jgi:hypothetical protein
VHQHDAEQAVGDAELGEEKVRAPTASTTTGTIIGETSSGHEQAPAGQACGG